MIEGSLSATDDKTLAEKSGGSAFAPQGPPGFDQAQFGIETPLPLPAAGEFTRARVGFWRRFGLFIATVILPMAVGAGFHLWVFAPRYASTVSLRVRSTDQSQTEQSALISEFIPIINEDTYVVNAYLTSRDIVDQLVKNDNLREILSRGDGDFVFRYPTFWLPDDNEFLYRRFEWMVKAKVDPATGISAVEVNAFTPEDTKALAAAVLRYAEALVNRMNDRYYHDQVAVADRYVADAQKDVDAIEAELKAFRDASGSLDPNLVALSELTVIQGLATQLAQVEASIVQQLKLARTSPMLAGLRAQALSYRNEIQKRRLEMAGTASSEGVKLRTYDLLWLRRTLALQALADAVTQKEQARLDAERQHLYVQLISDSTLAIDRPRYPRTTLNLLALLAICSAAFQVLRKLRDIAAHHAE